MSSCLVVQTHNHLFIGADSAISQKINDKYLRCSNAGKKLYFLNQEMLFISGNLTLVPSVLKIFSYMHNDKDIQYELNKLSLHKNDNCYDLEIIVAGNNLNGTYIKQYSQYNKFKMVFYQVDIGGINVVSAGFKTKELNDIASNLILNNTELRKVFESSFSDIKNENIGGILKVYSLSQNEFSLFDEFVIDQYINPYFEEGPDLHLLCADKVVGRLLLSKGLYVQNTSGTYTINDSGLIAQNGSYKVGINPNTPGDIFTISIDNKKLLYVDATNKKLKFEGDIESKSGHIASYVISNNDLTSGKVGMSSATTSGAISFWAGSTDRNNAAFRVDNNGKLTCSNANITGGTLKVGNNFSVDSSGKLTASNGKFTGTISGSTITGGTISGSELSGSEITGGSIEVGCFYADSKKVSMGQFVVYNGDNNNKNAEETYVFKSKNESFKLDTNITPGGAVATLFLGGSNGDKTSYVEFQGGNVRASAGIWHLEESWIYLDDIYMKNSDNNWTRYYSVADMFDHVYDVLDDLEDRVSSLE